MPKSPLHQCIQDSRKHKIPALTKRMSMDICFVGTSKQLFKLKQNFQKKLVVAGSIVAFFRRTYALSIGFKMKPLRKSVFQC